MRRTEERLRRPRSEEERVSALLRAGAKVPGVRSQGPMCGPCELDHSPQGHHPEECQGLAGTHLWVDRPAHVLSVLQLRAYCGDEVARDLVPSLSGNEIPLVKSWEDLETWPLDAWFTGLLRLARSLPEVAVSGPECLRPGPRNCPFDVLGRPCHACNGTGTRTVLTTAPLYLAACTGLAVGRAVLPVWAEQIRLEDRTVGGSQPDDMTREEFMEVLFAEDAARKEHEIQAATLALGGVERWTHCPCPDNAEAASALASDLALPRWAQVGLLLWPWDDATYVDVLRDRVVAAEVLIKPDVIRDAAKLMALGVTRTDNEEGR